MPQPQLQELLEAGVHFGHQTRRWNPKMRRFIFAERSGIYIIDLQKTMRQLEYAQELLRNVVLKGDGVLFVCTKKQIKRLKDLEQGAADGDFTNYTKKEQLLFDRERSKLDKNLAGIKNVGRLPGALFIVDAKKERIAVAEANAARMKTDEPPPAEPVSTGEKA